MSRILVIIQNMDVEQVATVEELIVGKAQLETVDSGYQSLGIETPEWVIDKLGETDREINSRVRGELQRRLRAAKARRAALRTREEQRSGLDSEIAELEKKLG